MWKKNVSIYFCTIHNTINEDEIQKKKKERVEKKEEWKGTKDRINPRKKEEGRRKERTNEKRKEIKVKRKGSEE